MVRELVRPARIWILVFLLLPWMDWQSPGVNAGSRLATMSAMSQQRTFQINSFEIWTFDWARTPDGRLYSNKAPGPMFIGYPFTWVWDRVRQQATGGPLLELDVRSDLYLFVLCFLFQILPCCWITVAALRRLERSAVSRAALHFAAIASLFGNTAALYMNTYFGHGMAAILTLAALLALESNRFVAAGWCFGLGALSDYGGIFLIPALLAAYVVVPSNRRRTAAQHWRVAGQVAAGAAVPAVLWIWYHTSAFGSPFTLPFKYQNPLFVGLVPPRENLGVWGIAQIVPDPMAAARLMFGSARGILYTQPWMLVVFAVLPFYWKRLADARQGIVFGIAGFAGLLWMNASFATWWGGNAPGPRYMSMVFPVLAVIAGWMYDRVSRPVRWALWSGLVVAVALRIVIYATDLYPPYGPSVWRYYTDTFQHALQPRRDVVLLYLVASLVVASMVSAALGRFRPTPPAPSATKPELAG